MDFKINNRYWLNKFIQDFIDYKKPVYNGFHISCFEVKDFEKKFVLKDRIDKKYQKQFVDTIKLYQDLSVNCILAIKQNPWHPETDLTKLDIIRHFYQYTLWKDPHNELDLNKIKFELLRINFGSIASDFECYLIVCDINKSINFELIYGTMKIINGI